MSSSTGESNDQTNQRQKIAILATDGYEQVELTDPKKNLEKAGATVEVISIKKGEIKGWNHTDWGQDIKRAAD